MRALVGVVVVAALLALVSLKGAQDWWDPSSCILPTMHPMYVPIDVNVTAARRGQPYALFLYRDVKHHASARQTSLSLHGIPVIFVHGSAGSFRQVRSVASAVAKEEARLGATAPSQLHDFFTIDFNEEFTGVHGQSVREQASYLNDVIHKVLELYHMPGVHASVPGYVAPESVILIGHSMGGLVSRAMVTLPNYVPGVVSHIFTLATPHMTAPATLEWSLDSIYAESNYYWRHHYSDAEAGLNESWRTLLDNVTILSVAGGNRDLMVNGDLVDVSSIAPPTQALTVWSTGMPGVWSSCDHMSIMWCEQLMHALARGFMAIRATSASEPTRVLPVKARLEALKDVYTNQELERLVGESLVRLPSHRRTGSTSAIAEPPADYEAVLGTPLVISGLDGSKQAHSISIALVSLVTTPVDVTLSIPVSMASSVSWHLFNEDSSESVTISPSRVAVLPTSSLGRVLHFVRLPPADVRNFGRLVILLSGPSGGGKVAVLAAHGIPDHTEPVNEGLEWRSWTLAPRRGKVASGTFSSIHFGQVTNSLFAYRLNVGAFVADAAELTATVRLFSPALREDKYLTASLVAASTAAFATNETPLRVSFHGFNCPQGAGKNSLLRPRGRDDGLRLQVWLDPASFKSNVTAIEVSLQVDIVGTLGQIFRRYALAASAVLPFTLLVLTLAKQQYVYDTTGDFPTMMSTLASTLWSNGITLFVLFTVIALLQEQLVSILDDAPVMSSLSTSILLGNDDVPLLLPVLSTVSFGTAAFLVFVASSIVHLLAAVFVGCSAILSIWSSLPSLVLTSAVAVAVLLASYSAAAGAVGFAVVLFAGVLLRSPGSASWLVHHLTLLAWQVLLVLSFAGPSHVVATLCAVLQLVVTVRALLIGSHPAVLNSHSSYLVLLFVLSLAEGPLAVAWFRNQVPLTGPDLGMLWSSVDQDPFGLAPIALYGLLLAVSGPRPRITSSHWLAFVLSWPLRLVALVVILRAVPFMYTMQYAASSMALILSVTQIATLVATPLRAHAKSD